MNTERPEHAAIAIVGMSCIYPGAGDLQSFWHNIKNGVDAITTAPAHRIDPVYFDVLSQDSDRLYCNRGGFIDEHAIFEPLNFGVMPKAAEATDPDQLLALKVGAAALADAGYLDREFNRDKAAVILGRGNYMTAGAQRVEQNIRLVQQVTTLVGELFPQLSADKIAELRAQLRAQVPTFNADSALGVMPNLVASRLANRLDLNGPAYTIDAACASSLLAVEQGVVGLRNGSLDLALVGGLHFTHEPSFWSVFCQLGAFSHTQQIRPFSSRADGILAGEGIGMVVLKRLSDAERDGDKIYAVLNGIAASSDGRANSLLTPSVDGQVLALQRAWSQTDLNPSHIGLIEAHGTGTPNGDEAELTTLGRFFGELNQGESRATLGSVKSMIGHAMPAAGIAGFIKTAMAVYDGVLPPSLHCDEPNEKLIATRFTVHGKAKPWAAKNRIAGVNAFGFGGINTHAVLSNFGRNEHTGFIAKNKPALPELLLLAADSIDALLQQLDDAINHSSINTIPANARYKLAIVQPNEKRFDLAKKVIAKNKPWRGRNQIYFSGDGLLTQGGKLALLFPGVDSAFEPQVEDVAAYFDLPLHECCKPMQMDDLGLVGMGIIQTNRLLHRALQQLGVQGDAVAGHSIGEWSAKVATDCWPETDLEDVMREMKPGALALPDVVFLAAGCGLDVANRVMHDLNTIELSHDNCPHQIIFCGSNNSIAIVEARLKEEQVMAQRLPFVSGFHSALFNDFLPEYRQYFDRFPFAEPKIPLWSSTTCALVPNIAEERRELAAQHLVKPVRFRQLTEALYDDGCRVFLQIGTGSLTGFIDDTLKGMDTVAMAANVPQKSGLEQLCNVAAGLWVEGLAIRWERLGLTASPIESRSKKSTPQIQLKLGVPFIHAGKALDAELTSTTQKNLPLPIATNSALDISALAASNDPLQQMLALTLNDMQQASHDVIHAWQASQQKVQQSPAVSPPKFSSTVADTILPIAPKATLKRHLDLNSNIPYVIDHAFYAQKPSWPDLRDVKPVVPLTMIVLMLREAVEELLPGIVVTAVEKVQAYSWMDVASPIDIELQVEPVEAGRAKVTIPGYCFGEVVYANTRSTPPIAGTFIIDNEKIPEYTPEFVYGDKVMFHGPAYQGIKSLDKIGTRSIQGTLKNPAGKGALLDNMAQVFGCLLVETEPKDAMAMPIGVDRVNFHQADPEIGAELETRATITLMNSEAINADLFLVDKNGALIFSVEGWNNRRFPMDKKFWSDTRMAHRRQACSEIADGKAVLFVDEYERVITRDYIVGRYLNQPEKAVYDKTPPRKKRSWLNGRVAAKDAIKQFLWAREAGLAVSEVERRDIWPKELRIHNLDNGQPVVAKHVNNEVFTGELFISIAHKDNLAVAMCNEKPVGIDIEKITPRDNSFIDVAFADSELQWINHDNRDERIALIWAAKEAEAKRRGTGLESKPKAFIVTTINGNDIEINGQHLQWQRHEDYVICWTL